MEEFDVIVVGAGSTGGALAGRLTALTDKRVLVLEAGPVYGRVEDMPEALLAPGRLLADGGRDNPHVWWYPARMSRDGDHGLFPRGRGLGGSSSVNGAYWIRGTREDFDGWAALGNDGWSFDEVLPFFVRGETDHDFMASYHGTTGPIPVRREPHDRSPVFTDAFVESAHDLGFVDEPDKNAPDSRPGVGPVPMNVDGGRRTGSALGYLLPAMSRPNLTVVGEVLVRRVVFDGSRATGVEAVVDGVPTVFRAGEIVLAAGTLRSPQLLMLSGIGPAAHLREHGIEVLADLPGVGQGMTDHPMVAAPWRGDIDLGERADRGLLMSAVHWQVGGSAVEILPFARRHATVPDSWDMRLVAFHADSRGSVGLASPDPGVAARLEWNLLSEPSDRAVLREAVRTTHALLSAAPLRAHAAQIVDLTARDLADDRRLDEWMLERIGAGHPASTCRMGPDSDALSVVDHALRVRGTEGLRIADTSVFPTNTSRGPHATTVMIGERAADLLAR